MTTSAEAGKKPVMILTATQVAEYLREHPEFFNEQTELVAELRIPHPVGPAISLLERQVTVMRDQNRDLKRKLMDLVQVARDNDRLNERMHQLILDLIKAGSLEQVIDTLNDHLRGEFKADTLSLLLYDMDRNRARECGILPIARDDAALEHFASFHKSGRPLCGRLKQAQLEFLFGDQAPAVGSAALVPIGRDASQGMLAIGSSEANRFHPGMGTLFLSHLGELISAVLEPHLPRASG
ncbi:MAG: DUF484 family protein [Gammaproteobacteria bacterium]|nr:DUF484 family protein [Gammaproteobacteria bacterium]